VFRRRHASRDRVLLGLAVLSANFNNTTTRLAFTVINKAKVQDNLSES
jgi:hypothetical protein